MESETKDKLVREGVDVLFDFVTEVVGSLFRNFFAVSKEADEKSRQEREVITDKFKDRVKGLIVDFFGD